MGKYAPQRRLKLFFDACFPPSIAKALGELDAASEYCVLTDEMPGNTPDTTWIPQLEKSRIVVSGDGRILSRPHERQVWLESGLTGFFIPDTFQNKKLWEQADFIVSRWPAVLDCAATSPPGSAWILRWGRNAGPELWQPPKRK